MTLPRWMRATLWATAVMNMLGALAFVPVLPMVREMMGWPSGHPLYLWIVAEFIFIFGAVYGYCAWMGRAPRMFICMGAIGKCAFVATLVGFWLGGDLSMQAMLGGTGDLIFTCLFVIWLIQTHGIAGATR